MGSSTREQGVKTVKPTEERIGTESTTETVFGTVPEQEDVSREEKWRRTYEKWLRTPFLVIWSDWRARAGMIIVSLYILMGTVGVWLTEKPYPNDHPRFEQPFQDLDYILGTDGLGQGLLRQTIHATPAMFKMILAGAVFATVLATIVGLVAGYKGGRVDRLLMTVSDIVITVPGLILVIVLAAWFQPRDPFVVGILLASHRWAGFSRSLRAQTLTLREESYVEASRAIDLSTFSVISKDLLPNLAPLIAIYFMNASRGIIFSSAGLYFLGVLPFTTLNWGVTMNLAYSSGGSLYTWDTAHWLLVPMGAIIFLSLGLILLAQGMDRLFNPRIRAKHDTNLKTDEEADEDLSTTAMIDQ